MTSTGIRVLVLALVCAAALPFAISPAPAAGAADVIRADRDRIRSHLRAVEARLRAADVSHLTPDQRARRLTALDDLRAYRRAGRFPHNHSHTERTPLFRDEHGTLCAMAYLIERSGHGALVDRVAASRNDAYIRDLAGDPGLIAWLEEHGMTTAEAALVQPAYEPVPEPEGESGSALTRSYEIVGGVLLAADAAASLLAGPRRRDVGPGRALLALGAGAASAGSALYVLNDGADRTTRVVAAANVALGTVAAALGFFHLSGGPDEALGMRLLPAGTALSIRPALVPAEARPGLLFDVRY